jgi:hypothetical protein
VLDSLATTNSSTEVTVGNFTSFVWLDEAKEVFGNRTKRIRRTTLILYLFWDI